MRGVPLSPGAYDPAACNLCGSRDSTTLLELPPPALTSDGRILQEPLGKIECAGCGLVRTAFAFDERRLETHYTSYELGVAAAVSEPMFFTAAGVKPRSEVIFDWLRASLGEVSAPAPASILEVGCGEGSVLARFQRAFPASAIDGLDLSAASVAAASANGLRARQGSYRDARGPYDLIYAFAVIEHVPSPSDFIGVLGSRLSPAGMLVLSQPCQDHGSNDVFLADHLHHFSSWHVSELGRRAGLVERLRLVGQPLIPDFSLHVFSRGGAAAPPAPPPDASGVRAAIGTWHAVFSRVDRWLQATRHRPLAVWGVGQTFQMLWAYSRLKESSITIGLDDNAARFAGRLAFPVSALEAADLAVGARVLLTFAPRPAVVDRLRARGLDWFSPFEESPA